MVLLKNNALDIQLTSVFLFSSSNKDGWQFLFEQGLSTNLVKFLLPVLLLLLLLLLLLNYFYLIIIIICFSIITISNTFQRILLFEHVAEDIFVLLLH